MGPRFPGQGGPHGKRHRRPDVFDSIPHIRDHFLRVDLATTPGRPTQRMGSSGQVGTYQIKTPFDPEIEIFIHLTHLQCMHRSDNVKHDFGTALMIFWGDGFNNFISKVTR